MTTRRRNVKRRVKAVSRKTNNTQLHLKLEGGQTGTPVVPSRFVLVPWNSLTVVFRGISTTTSWVSTMDNAGLQSGIVSQIGLGNFLTTATLSIRVIKVKAWSQTAAQFTGVAQSSATGEVGDILQLTPYNYQTGGEMNTISSSAGPVEAPRVAFVWPVAVSSIPMGTNNTVTQLRGRVAPTASTATTSILMYFYLLWRPVGPPPNASTVTLTGVYDTADVKCDNVQATIGVDLTCSPSEVSMVECSVVDDSE